MVDDQRFASYRPDVLVYQSDILTEDVTIAGPINPKLRIASTATDSDFDVKLIDVYPENYPDPDDASGRANKRQIDALRCTWAATSSSYAANPCGQSSATAGKNQKPSPRQDRRGRLQHA